MNSMTSNHYVRAYDFPESIYQRGLIVDCGVVGVGLMGGFIAASVGANIEKVVPSTEGLTALLFGIGTIASFAISMIIESNSDYNASEVEVQYAKRIKKFEPHQIISQQDYNDLMPFLTDDQQKKLLSRKFSVCSAELYEACLREETAFWQSFTDDVFEKFPERYASYCQRFPDDSMTIQKFLKSKLTADNFGRIKYIAETYNMEALQKDCRRYFEDNKTQMNYCLFSHSTRNQLRV